MGNNYGTPQWVLQDELAGFYRAALASELRAARARQGVSQTLLAEAVGTTRRTLTRIETGKVATPSELVARMIWALHLDLGEFYDGVERRCYELMYELEDQEISE